MKQPDHFYLEPDNKQGQLQMNVCVQCVPILVFVFFLVHLHVSPSVFFGCMHRCVCVHISLPACHASPCMVTQKEVRGHTINLHLVIYEGVCLSGIQRRVVQLILLCWRGEPRGICASCHLHSLLIALSYSACCRQQPRGRERRKTK